MKPFVLPPGWVALYNSEGCILRILRRCDLNGRLRSRDLSPRPPLSPNPWEWHSDEHAPASRATAPGI